MYTATLFHATYACGVAPDALCMNGCRVKYDAQAWVMQCWDNVCTAANGMGCGVAALCLQQSAALQLLLPGIPRMQLQQLIGLSDESYCATLLPLDLSRSVGHKGGGAFLGALLGLLRVVLAVRIMRMSCKVASFPSWNGYVLQCNMAPLLHGTHATHPPPPPPRGAGARGAVLIYDYQQAITARYDQSRWAFLQESVPMSTCRCIVLSRGVGACKRGEASLQWHQSI
jgi:hypothetical protein